MPEETHLEFIRLQLPRLKEAAYSAGPDHWNYSALVPVREEEALGVYEFKNPKFDIRFTGGEIESAITGGFDLPVDRAVGALRAMERRIYEIAIEGDRPRDWSGITNSFAVHRIQTNEWTEKSPDQVIDEVGGIIYDNSGRYGRLANTLLLPPTMSSRLASQSFLNGASLLQNLKEANPYTGMTGKCLMIRSVPALEEKGTNGERRAVAYWRDSSVLGLHLPTACAFGEPEADGQGGYVVHGHFRTGGLKISEPEEIRYLDGI